ncbi:kinase-like domain-containing protein [Emericellopsis atlantica]|uniref:EKC/KEOPS complex subunit BUD32 n=1 Tax=Emericellopsis atlantica TaxID=2614577 RepID=A0A9P7ZEB3_9HYPO|nr:kinase-like domain-containing protein [Emericellopsis atlantica]KAG9249980.1 kinase-like domain-containing protein [Emericellopsis atlantica]
MSLLNFMRLPSWRQLWRLIAQKLASAHSLVIQFLGGKRQSLSEADASLIKLPGKLFFGSTACFFRIRPGIILKAPVTVLEDQIIRERPSVFENFHVERQILERLGEHPLIVRYLGWQVGFPTGLLFAEASHGSLQRLIDERNEDILPDVRRKWICQVIESVAYAHSRGIIHSDLRPDNFLVHGTWPREMDIWLCDFGGSTCKELDLSANKLPDAGFFNPNSTWTPSPSVDIFSLGSVLYTILTGHWPFRAPGGQFATIEEMEDYENVVDGNFARGIFPDVEGLWGGEIILGCWTHKFLNMHEIMTEIMSLQSDEK